MDLHLRGSSETVLADLQHASRLDLGDFLAFLVEPDRNHPTIDGDGMVSEGLRFRVQGQLAGKIYGMPFGLGVGFGDVLTEPPDMIDGSDFLHFVGVPRARHRVYPCVVHIAEKLHAYTLPRKRENSRVKDLPDIALLAQVGRLEADRLRAALRATFELRKTQSLPPALPPPPPSWEGVYERMAREDELPWRTLPELLVAVRAFIDPVLAGATGTWEPDRWSW